MLKNHEIRYMGLREEAPVSFRGNWITYDESTGETYYTPQPYLKVNKTELVFSVDESVKNYDDP